jgi:hypothetical protein
VKAWFAMILLPMLALLPDITYILVQKIFYPTLTDAIMLKQQRDPYYVYEGFDDVYIPQLSSVPLTINLPVLTPVIYSE